jgi:hypothetical protein
LFFIWAAIAAIAVMLAQAVNEHSKHELGGFIVGVWLLVGTGGLICGNQTLEVIKTGTRGLGFGSGF